ncbi:MAG TPA: hypothetical protein VF533_18030 [Solirubrobacteraceae bacterium]|jgi:hypothetical protein
MPRPRPRTLLPLIAVALAGCTAGQATSAGKFKGEEKKVAEVVDDLQTAGQAKDAGEICSRILAPELVDKLAAPGRSCSDEVDKALDDADDFALDVKDVAVTGTTATARVEDADDKPRELRLVKQSAGWRIASLGA